MASKIAIALAGGGPLGAIYEIGALCALEESLKGIDLNRLDHYVGVSAGSFIAAALANGMSPRTLCSSFIENDGAEAFDPAWLLKPASTEFVRRSIMLPGLAASALWRASVGGYSLLHAAERLGRALPTGLFSNDEIDHQLSTVFSVAGRSNDFRQLRTRLTLVATNLDSGESAPFGSPGWDHVPISKAVQASSALPGLFPPVEIDDQYYVDGALKKTMHASVALDEGVDLMICLNPLVPFNATVPGPTDKASRVMERGLPIEQRRIPRLVDGGLPAVLSQTFRSIIHSRLELGMKHYARSYPDTDIVLIEPDHRDPRLYLANTFSYRERRELAEHAYQQTRSWLRSNRNSLKVRMERHGVAIDFEALEDPARHLIRSSDRRSRAALAFTRLQDTLDDLGQALALQDSKPGIARA